MNVEIVSFAGSARDIPIAKAEYVYYASAVDTVTFQNKKPKAILTGSATLAENTTGADADKFGPELIPFGRATGQKQPFLQKNLFQYLIITFGFNSF